VFVVKSDLMLVVGIGMFSLMSSLLVVHILTVVLKPK
jgi:hypothetical protein